MNYEIDNQLFISLIYGDKINDPQYKDFYSNVNGIVSVIIKRANISRISLTEEMSYPYDICIIDSEFADELSIANGKFKRIEFHNVKFPKKGRIIFKGGIVELALFKDNSELNAVIIEDGNFGFISFNDCTAESITIRNGKIDSLNLMYAALSEHLTMWGGDIKNFNISGSYKLGQCVIPLLTFVRGSVFTLNIGGSSEINKLDIKSGIFNNIIFKSNGLKEVTIVRNPLFPTYPEIKINTIEFRKIDKLNFECANIEVKNIKFIDSFASKDAIIRVVNISLEEISFNKFTNYGQITFSDVKLGVDSKFLIENTDLGKTSLVNCSVNECKLEFSTSKITEIFVSGTTMPRRINGSSENKRLAYGQIKKVYDNKGDSVGANFFYSKEMNAYIQTLGWRQDFWEKLNLSLNKISTNHGQSWERGIFSTLLSSVTLYSIYIYLLGFRLNFSHGASTAFFDLWSFFFEFINPVHKTDYIAEALSKVGIVIKSDITSARLFEGFARIPIAYFIYQLIQAFRKHGKR